MSQALERSEGCWAWVVLLASVVTQGLTLGFPTCIGIFFTELQREFQASNSETSWFPSILTAMLHAGGEQGGEGLGVGWGVGRDEKELGRKRGSHNFSGLLGPSLWSHRFHLWP